MTTGFATSSDGTRIAYETKGDPSGMAFLLIHGWSQYLGCWDALTERLRDRYHLVAMDLRGHGASGKPNAASAYTDTVLWGDDVQAVIDATALERPILVGWSYGSRVVAAHLATHGAGGLSGVVLAGGILALGTARDDWMMGSASPGLDRNLYTDNVRRRLAATARFVEACTAAPQPRADFAESVGANMLCPPHVRRALFGVDLDLRPVYAAMTCPGLVIHGSADTVVSPRTGQAAADAMPNGQYLPYDGIGHAPFLEAPDRFAADLDTFASHVTQAAA